MAPILLSLCVFFHCALCGFMHDVCYLRVLLCICIYVFIILQNFDARLTPTTVLFVVLLFPLLLKPKVFLLKLSQCNIFLLESKMQTKIAY